MPLGTRLWGAGKVLLLVGALASTFLAFALLGMRVAVRAREVTVPDVVAHDVDEAASLLRELDLALRVDPVRRPDVRVPAGRILAQDPAAGERTRRMRAVRVWVSAGPRIARVPNLVGESERSARALLVQEGLTEPMVAEIRSSEYPADVVVAQTPDPGEPATEVHLLVNRGEERVSFVMPDVIGMPGERAAVALRAQGFRVSVAPQQAMPGIPPGVVVRQTPPGGYQIQPGDFITLEVSR